MLEGVFFRSVTTAPERWKYFLVPQVRALSCIDEGIIKGFCFILLEGLHLYFVLPRKLHLFLNALHSHVRLLGVNRGPRMRANLLECLLIVLFSASAWLFSEVFVNALPTLGELTLFVVWLFFSSVFRSIHRRLRQHFRVRTDGNSLKSQIRFVVFLV